MTTLLVIRKQQATFIFCASRPLLLCSLFSNVIIVCYKATRDVILINTNISNYINKKLTSVYNIINLDLVNI